MKWPWTSRRRAEQHRVEAVIRGFERDRNHALGQLDAITLERNWLRERNEQLVDTIIAFKRDGFAIPTKGNIKQAPDVDDRVLKRVEGGLTREFIQNARSAMTAAGVPAADAEREARRLREEAVSEHPGSD